MAASSLLSFYRFRTLVSVLGGFELPGSTFASAFSFGHTSAGVSRPHPRVTSPTENAESCRLRAKAPIDRFGRAAGQICGDDVPSELGVWRVRGRSLTYARTSYVVFDVIADSPAAANLQIDDW